MRYFKLQEITQDEFELKTDGVTEECQEFDQYSIIADNSCYIAHNEDYNNDMWLEGEEFSELQPIQTEVNETAQAIYDHIYWLHGNDVEHISYVREIADYIRNAFIVK